MAYPINCPTSRTPFFGALVAFIALLFVNSLPSSAQSPALGRAMKAQDAKAGTLLVHASDHGQRRPMPTLATDVEINVTGMISRSIVTQHFANPTDEWLEGIYVFPLSDSAAVDTLLMKIGERVIIGEIEERVKAKTIYEEAKKVGKKASLLEQERPNIFTASVANIGPGEVISITIEYQEDLRYSQGEFSLRFPMVVGPRYIPGTQTITGFSGTGWSHDTDQVSDASRITPPVADPSKGLTHPVSIRVHIDAGFPIHINSPSHDIQVTEDSYGTLIALNEQTVLADSDFVLEWRPRVGDAPNAALFSDAFQGDTYALLMLMPPSDPGAVVERLPRETIFVIDTSGSMDGTSIHQAKDALLLALTKLTPEDSFNLIQFNDQASRRWTSSRSATPKNVHTAIRYVKQLSAGGGTEAMPALQLALSTHTETSKVQQVIFITDGSVGNESNLFRYIKKNLGKSRLFTVGIGSAPNSHFMRKAAEYGSGSFTYIGSTSEVQKKMDELFSKLESPVLSQIVIDWKGQRAEHWPKYIPDLYLGEPVVIAAKLPKLSAEARIIGYRGEDQWAVDFNLEGGSTHSGIDRLFARRKIDSLNSRLIDSADADAVRAEIVTIGLTHHLVTEHTSLVAVERMVSRSKGESYTSSAIPTNLPKGWVMEDIWAQRGQWDQEMKNMREEVERAREEAAYLVAQVERNENTSVTELRKMLEELRIEEERRLAKAAGKALSSASYSASPSRPTASDDAHEATASYGEAIVEEWRTPTADQGSVDAAVSVVVTTLKRTATAQGSSALPQTSTGAALLLLVGLLLLGLAFVATKRRWKLA